MRGVDFNSSPKPGEPLASEATREAQAYLRLADLQWAGRDAAGRGAAIRSCDAALATLGEQAPELRARAWLKRGQILESGRTPELCLLAARSHESGLAVLDVEAGRGDEVGGEVAAASAPGEGTLRALLWMNRGNALLAIGEREAAREAIRSYELACGFLAPAAHEADGPERWAMAGAAWLNRASALRLVGEGGSQTEAADDLDEAIAFLTKAAEAGHRAARRNLAGAWLNRGLWRERAGDLDAALAAWREAARAAEPEARRDPVALEASLQARGALCAALGRRRAKDSSASAEEAAEMFAQVEAGLADHAAWENFPEATRDPAARLFEFGAWLYRVCAPGRLADFLGRHARPDEPRWVEAARVAVQMARQEILAGGFTELLGEAGGARLRELQEVEARLPAPAPLPAKAKAGQAARLQR